MNPLLDAFSAAGYALDTPGALLRGALSGKFGERASGQDLLSSYGLSSPDDPYGGLKGFGVEAVLDPLSLAGPALGAFKGIRAATRGAQALSHADDANPLLKAVAGFAGDEAGAIGHPEAVRLLQSQENPLGRFGAMAEHSPATLDITPESQLAQFSHGRGDPAAVAMYDWLGTRQSSPNVLANLKYDQWGDPAAMEELVRRNVRQGALAGPVHADSFPVHEIGHAFHDEALAPQKLSVPWMAEQSFQNPGVTDDIRRHLGEYATTNPSEFVAEAFTNQMLRGEPLPPILRNLYQDLHGPDLDKLPPEFLNAWWNLPRR